MLMVAPSRFKATSTRSEMAIASLEPARADQTAKAAKEALAVGKGCEDA